MALRAEASWHDYLLRAQQASLFTVVADNHLAFWPTLWGNISKHALMFAFPGRLQFPPQH